LIARGGGFIVGADAAATAILGTIFFFYGTIVFAFLLVLSAASLILTLNFFRDPDRKPGDGLVAPADGIVSIVEKRDAGWLIATFMNIHNVHVNRAPVDCTVARITRHGGPRNPAYAPDAGKNFRVAYELHTDHGTVILTQIAGVVARRIVPYVSEGEPLVKGQRLGLIRFGSRVDLLIPQPGRGGTLEPRVKKGDRVRAGETTLAVYK
jgi:phosphatidylserine decarboxylase